MKTARRIANPQRNPWPVLTAALLLIGAGAFPAQAASPGLPFTEDFSDRSLLDFTQTNADWSSELGLLRLPRARVRFAPFPTNHVHEEITTDSRDTDSIAVGDMDGDGDLDLIAADVGTWPRLYLNQGGTPIVWTTSDIGPFPIAGGETVVADVNLDGALDLLVANPGTGPYLYLNNRTADPLQVDVVFGFFGDADVTSVAVGDVDGDGDPDFVFGKDGPNSLWLNDGDTDGFGWTAGTMSSVAHATTAVELADIDGDGDLDLVEGNDGSRAYFFLNNGTADPWNGVGVSSFPSSAAATRDLVVADFDGDGDLDVAEGNYMDSDRIYYNDGGSPPVWHSDSFGDPAIELLSHAVGDVDNDGDLDLVQGNAAGRARLRLNGGMRIFFSRLNDIGSSTAPTRDVLLADMDGDGALDLVVADNGVNRLYRNGGSPNPWNGLTSGYMVPPESSYAGDIALGDVDGDGDLDMVHGNYMSYPNKLYLNDGSTLPFVTTVGQDITADMHITRGVALGDIDGDGDLDLVVGNESATNRLYLNLGGTPVTWAASDITSDIHGTQGIALGDVDGDGDLDVVAGNYDNVNRLYLNGGGSPISWTASNITNDVQYTMSIALGDMDGDGDLDLVEGTAFDWNRLFLNNGSSDPWNGVAGQNIGLSAAHTNSIALADFEGDGDLDVVTGNYYQPDRLVRNSGGSPISWTETDLTTDPTATRAIDVSDVDGDGYPDVVAVFDDGFTPNRLYVNPGHTWGFWRESDITDDDEAVTAVALGDVDRNGSVDLLVGRLGLTGRLYMSLKDGDPWNRFEGEDISTDTHNTRDGALGDVDGDGDLDLVVGNVIGTNRLYLNSGTEYPWLGVIPTDITSDDLFTTGVALGDMDGDGDLDLVAVHAGQTNRLYRNDGGNPLVWSGFDITSDAFQTNAVALVDVDLDGDLDVVTVEAGSANHWYSNDGGSPLSWTSYTMFGDSDFSTSLAVGDVDGDGDPDVLVGTTDSPNRLYHNLAGNPPIWTRSDVTADVHATWSVLLQDVEGDGDLDVLAGNLGQANRIYMNEGGAPIIWSADDIGTAVENTRVLAAADMDRDGDLDLVVGNEGQSNHVFFQDFSDTILDLTADTQATFGLAVGDVDGDGDPDVVALNGPATNRLYRAQRFDTVRRRAASFPVDTEPGDITNALLGITASFPPGTRADLLLSNNGGVRWEPVRDGEPMLFQNASSDLRWRIELISASPSLTPLVDQLDISTAYHPSFFGDRVWEDLDGDGFQDPGEPGIVAALIYLLDGYGVIQDVTFTDANGAYYFSGVWGDDYRLKFVPPPGYVISPQDQGNDDALDSDVRQSDGEIGLTLRGFDYHTRWDAGMVPAVACMPPDEPVYIYTMTLTDDGNAYPVLHFMDPNQPDAITGYHVYRSSDPVPPPDTWPLLATDIIDMDEATPNKQWVDTSGDVSPTGSWYYQVTGYNHRCPAQDAEGPF